MTVNMQHILTLSDENERNYSYNNHHRKQSNGSVMSILCCVLPHSEASEHAVAMLCSGVFSQNELVTSHLLAPTASASAVFNALARPIQSADTGHVFRALISRRCEGQCCLGNICY